MKPQALATLALRILAIFLASKSFIYIASETVAFIYSGNQASGSLMRTVTTLWVFGPLIAALAIWWAAPWFARHAARGMDDSPLAVPDADILVNTAFMIAGVLIFVLAVPELALSFLRVWNLPDMAGLERIYPISQLLANVLRCLLGIFLALRSRGISRFVLWLRYAGSSGANRPR